MNYQEIEQNARELQVEIWRQRDILCPSNASQPIRLCEPQIAAQLLDIDFQYHHQLGRFGDKNARFETAGSLDRARRVIAISERFPPETIRFTGAHEIAHWRLHPNEVSHRDRPISGLSTRSVGRSPIEKEADYFAACFLMPRKLVVERFELTFGVRAPFIFDEAIAFSLCPDDPESVLRPDVDSIDPALVLAAATSFRGRHFDSLATYFRVSITTVAIRLNELRLIRV